MKKTAQLLLLSALSATVAFSSAKPLPATNAKGVPSDSIKIADSRVLQYSSTSVTRCEKGSCILPALNTIKAYPASSYVLVYKNSASEWFINKSPDAKSLSSIAAKKITILEGNIRIMGVDYVGKKYAVVVE